MIQFINSKEKKIKEEESHMFQDFRIFFYLDRRIGWKIKKSEMLLAADSSTLQSLVNDK